MYENYMTIKQAFHLFTLIKVEIRKFIFNILFVKFMFK